MVRWLVGRVVSGAVLVVLASSTALVLTRLAPGDVTTQLGPFASRAEIERTRERFGLDRPVPVEWAVWVSRAVRLDFGTSFLYNRPVSGLLGRAAANTGLLATLSLGVATVLGVVLGLLTAGPEDGCRRWCAPHRSSCSRYRHC
jgi:peptide/nickel transport system permease protein